MTMNIDFKNVPQHYNSKSHEKMQEVLMDPSGVGPAIHYHMLRGSSENQKNITVLEPGTISEEYIKTYGHYHIGNLEETYWFVYGQGVVLLQKLAIDNDGKMIVEDVADFKAIPVAQGEKVLMPSGYGHVIVNTGDDYLVSSDDTVVYFEEKDPTILSGYADYEPVKKMQGFAYYVVEKNGKPALKRNYHYKNIQKEDLGGLPVIE